jgi:hypothetical protein
MFPKAPQTLRHERVGVAALARAAADINVIWRETSTADVGVDGHLEFIDAAGQSNGAIARSPSEERPIILPKGRRCGLAFLPGAKA